MAGQCGLQITLQISVKKFQVFFFKFPSICFLSLNENDAIQNNFFSTLSGDLLYFSCYQMNFEIFPPPQNLIFFDWFLKLIYFCEVCVETLSLGNNETNVHPSAGTIAVCLALRDQYTTYSPNP